MGKDMSLRIEHTLLWDILVKIVRAGMVVCSIVTTVVIFTAAFMRYVLHKDFYGVDDIILLFAFWLYFLGAVHGSYENSHIKADILMTLMRNVRLKEAINLIGQVVLVGINVILIIWAWQFFMRGIVEMPKTTALHIPYFIPRFAIFLGLLLMELYHVVYLIKNVRNYFKYGYFSEEIGQYDYLPDSTLKKHPDAGIPSKAEANHQKELSKLEKEV